VHAAGGQIAERLIWKNNRQGRGVRAVYPALNTIRVSIHPPKTAGRSMWFPGVVFPKRPVQNLPMVIQWRPIEDSKRKPSPKMLKGKDGQSSKPDLDIPLPVGGLAKSRILPRAFDISAEGKETVPIRCRRWTIAPKIWNADFRVSASKSQLRRFVLGPFFRPV